jgi:hypothetical protein
VFTQVNDGPTGLGVFLHVLQRLEDAEVDRRLQVWGAENTSRRDGSKVILGYEAPKAPSSVNGVPFLATH